MHEILKKTNLKTMAIFPRIGNMFSVGLNVKTYRSVPCYVHLWHGQLQLLEYLLLKIVTNIFSSRVASEIMFAWEWVSFVVCPGAVFTMPSLQ